MNKTTLKILSFVIAAFTWLIVTNMEDPVTEVTFYNIPVTIANASYLESNSQIPALTDGKDTVNVTIKAKSSVIKDLDQEDTDHFYGHDTCDGPSNRSVYGYQRRGYYSEPGKYSH